MLVSLLHVIQFFAGIVMSVEGGAEAIIKTNYDGHNVMHFICENRQFCLLKLLLKS